MTYWKFKLLAYFYSFMHSFSWCKSASSFYFKMCLEHMNQIKLASICTKVGRFHCLVYRPANIFSSCINLCWEIEKSRWNRKKYHHDLISFNYLGSYWRICHILWTPIYLLCFAAFVISSLTIYERSSSSDLGVTVIRSRLPAHGRWIGSCYESSVHII